MNISLVVIKSMSSLLCKRVDFLLDFDAELKTIEKRQRVIEQAASGVDLQEICIHSSDEPMVEFGKDG